MANQRISILVALDGADEGLKRAITSAERSLGELAASAKTAGDRAAAGIAQVKAGVSVISEQITTRDAGHEAQYARSGRTRTPRSPSRAGPDHSAGLEPALVPEPVLKGDRLSSVRCGLCGVDTIHPSRLERSLRVSAALARRMMQHHFSFPFDSGATVARSTRWIRSRRMRLKNRCDAISRRFTRSESVTVHESLQGRQGFCLA
ncbi:hypothetical protein ACI2T4_25970, partial [Ralstonia nicotianae]